MMTPDWELIELIRNKYVNSDCDIMEIIEAMRDEGYLSGTDADLAELAALCKQAALNG